MPSFTFYASAEAIPHTGARPVFCDVDPETFCVTAGDGGARAHARHAGGDRRPPVRTGRACRRPARSCSTAAAWRSSRTAAQAAGARRGGRRAGSLGDAATFSFFPSKNLFCFGDGGAIATNDDEVAAHARTLRFHGSRDKSTFTEVGWNSRLDALQAAVLRVDPGAARRLERPPQGAGRGLRGRRGSASWSTLPRARRRTRNRVHHLYAVRAEDPDAASRALADAGIAARSVLPRPGPHAARDGGVAARRTICQARCGLRRTNLALPMGPTLSPDTARAGGRGAAPGRTLMRISLQTRPSREAGASRGRRVSP